MSKELEVLQGLYESLVRPIRNDFARADALANEKIPLPYAMAQAVPGLGQIIGGAQVVGGKELEGALNMVPMLKLGYKLEKPSIAIGGPLKEILHNIRKANAVKNTTDVHKAGYLQAGGEYE